MYLHQFYDASLAQASYLIGCQATGEAIVIDALRDIAPYLQVAADEQLRITNVTETHIHADFVSGSRELCARTGARLHLSAEGGRDWQYAFAASDGARLLHDGDRIVVGNIHLDVLHTPGHTPEHLCFVVTDTPRAAGAMGIVSGDFVFVGDVGRPDLLERAAHMAGTMDASARQLFASLEKFRALPDHLQVWPGHGAGSACGKALGAIPSSTVGYEKLSNWGVGMTDESEFVRAVLDGQPEPPTYFAEMKRINRDGPTVLGALPNPPELPAFEIVSFASSTAWILDLRPASQFAHAHVPGSISLPMSRSFSTWAGWMVPYDADIVLLLPSAHEDSAVATHDSGIAPGVVTRTVSNTMAASRHLDAARDAAHAARELAMIGLDRVRGWIDAQAALAAWQDAGEPLQAIAQLSVDAVAAGLTDGSLNAIDVRAHSEWVAGHLPRTPNIPVGHLAREFRSLPSGPLVMQCQGGTRSAIAASLLHKLGRPDAVNLVGGFAAWVAAGLPVER
jgi:hydroxyacylglutathione hydrolase